MEKIMRPVLYIGVIFLFLQVVFPLQALFDFEKTITIPAEESQGITLDLEKGEYMVEIAGGAMTLFYPINPNYRWLIGVAVGTNVEGGQDEPNIGTLYFEPNPPVYSQRDAEAEALQATKDKLSGTYLRFMLEEDREVRFWVSDFDYSDNSGMVKLNVHLISE